MQIVVSTSWYVVNNIVAKSVNIYQFYIISAHFLKSFSIAEVLFVMFFFFETFIIAYFTFYVFYKILMTQLAQFHIPSLRIKRSFFNKS